MQLLPTSTLGSYQLPSSQVQLHYFDERDLTFIYDENTKLYHLFRQNATVLETNVIPDSPTIVHPISPCDFILVASDNSIYLSNLSLNSTSPDDGSRHISKKLKLNNGSSNQYQKLFQASGSVDWVRHVAKTLYASSVASNCIHIYDFSSAKHETVPMPQPLGRSFPTCFSKVDFGNDEMSELDPIFADHFGINCLHGVFVGFENGSICYIPDQEMLKGTIMIAQLQFETIMGIHSCQLISGSVGKNLLIFVGSKGTIQVYSKCMRQKSHQVIYFKEFTLPSTITSISFIKESPTALVLCKSGQMCHLEFSQATTSKHEETSEIIMELTQFQGPEDLYCVQAIKKQGDIITYQIITRNGTFSACKVDLGASPVAITRTADSLKKAISDALDELSEIEASQIEMGAYHEDINRQLVTLNRTLYTLQNASLNKKRHQNTDDFSLDIAPFVKYAPITGQPQPCLRIRLETKLDLNWTDWHLNIDISTLRTTKQESDTYALDKSDYTSGKTFLLPLDGFEHDQDDTGIVQIWERDLELEHVNCPLPLEVYVSLNMDMDTKADILKDSLVLEYLPITDNASNSCTSFLVTFMIVDHLHFAIPLSDSCRKRLKQNGLKDVTTQLSQKRWNRSTRSNMFEMDNKNLRHDILNYETSNIRLRFVAPANADELYRTVLSTLLSEGKSSDEVRRFVDDAEHASLSLVSHPMFPVTITLSKVTAESNNGDLFLNIQLQSLSTHVLVIIEMSLLSRLQPYITDDDGDDTGANLIGQDSSTYYQTHQQLENHLESLEKCYQRECMGNDDDIWQKLKAAWDLTRQLQNDTWLCIHNFSI